MNRPSQQLLTVLGSAIILVVIAAVFVAFSSPQNRSDQKEKIYIESTITSRIGEKINDYVRISDMQPNSMAWFVYPNTVDIQGRDAYQKFILVRLPEEMGGSKNDSSAFRAYSALSLNSHCFTKYWPQEGRKRLEDPCAGDIIRPQDGLVVINTNPMNSGIFVSQPYLGLSSDPQGYLYVEPPTWDFEKNGVVGIGRKATAEEFEDAAIHDLKEFVAKTKHDIELPQVLSDGTILTPSTEEGHFIYRDKIDARIRHDVVLSYCRCADNLNKAYGGNRLGIWSINGQSIYTDEWVSGSSAYRYVTAIFFKDGYEISISGRSVDDALSLVFDNFYKDKKISMLQRVA